jgi:1,4-dihydroxy-2-naphthoate octaprenyltransferase
VVEDAAICIAFGPLLMLGTYAALTGTLHFWLFLVSLPLGLLAESILHASHLQTFSADVNANIRTLAVLLGWDRARLLFYLLASLPYGLVALLVLIGILPGWAWVTFFSGLLAGWHLLAVWRATTPESPAFAELDRQMALTHLAFGVLLAFSLMLG